MKRKKLQHLLLSAGLPVYYLGYDYLVDAIYLAAEDLSRLRSMRKEIYLPIAEKYHVSYFCVERNIRTARDVLYRRMPADFFSSVGLPPLPPYTQPYPREYIALFAEYLNRIS